MIIDKFKQRKSRRQKNRQKPISVASQEKKSQIATLATDSAIPDNKQYQFILNKLDHVALAFVLAEVSSIDKFSFIIEIPGTLELLTSLLFQ